jgi:hypothetical protein
LFENCTSSGGGGGSGGGAGLQDALAKRSNSAASNETGNLIEILEEEISRFGAVCSICHHRSAIMGWMGRQYQKDLEKTFRLEKT